MARLTLIEPTESLVMDFRALARLARPHQYTKNVLLFAAPLAAGRLDESEVLWKSLVGFVVFCLVSSAGYVLNDLRDIERDRAHPRKSKRPLASGRVTPGQARVLIGAMLAVSVPLVFVLPPEFAACAVGYAVLTFTYTLVFKTVPWVELIAVSGGFLLRGVAGAAATDVDASWWFLTVIVGATSLTIVGKRLAELISLGSASPTRAVLSAYTPSALRGAAMVTSALAVVAYGIWAATATRVGNRAVLLLTVVPFALAMGRWLQLVLRGEAEVPELLVFRDRPALASLIMWASLFIVAVYV